MKKLLLTLSIAAYTSALFAQVGTTPSGTNTNVTTPSGTMPANAMPSGTMPSGTMPASAYPAGTYPPSTVPTTMPPSAYPGGAYPATTYPAGTVPPAGYPAGTYPPTNYPPSTYPAGTIPPSAYPGGAYPPTTYPAGTYPPAAYPVGSRINMSPGVNTGSSVLTSKKGENILPQAGDWAISFDATPFLSYLGNFLSSKGNTAPTVNFLNNNQTIIGKYYVDDNTAYRGLVRIGFNSYTQNEEISTSSNVNDTLFPVPQVEDQRSITNHFIGLGAGIEKRKGHTRLQGYYGVELMVYITGSDTTYKYGNSYNTTTNPTPAYYNWTNSSLSNLAIGAPRYTENSPGSTFGISLLGFVGVEYFFAPKISIGGEFTWGIGFHSTGQGSITLEEINPRNNVDATDTYTTGGSSGFNLDTGLNQAFGSGSGSLNITFHF